jgi:glutamate/aspartate transport system permease protein
MSLDFSFLTLKVINNIILTGLIFSIKLTLISMVLGIILGTLLAMMRLSKYKFLSSFALAYVTIIRSIPLVMVILWVFLLIPLFIGRSLGTEYSAIITFTLFEAAF